MSKLSFGVYSALMYSAFTLAFSYVVATSFWTSGAAPIFFIFFLFVEFCTVLLLSWFTLKHVAEFRARSIILATNIIGWFPASLFLAWMIGLYYHPTFYPPGYEFSMYFTIAALFSLFHSITFCVGALIGALVPVSYADLLKRKILFTVSKNEDAVDLLKLAVSLQDDPLNVRDGVLHLIKEGYIVGYFDKVSNKLHVSLTRSLSPTFGPSGIQPSEGLVREYNILKSLLTDLEELRKQDRISSSSYDALREEYERRLKMLALALR